MSSSFLNIVCPLDLNHTPVRSRVAIQVQSSEETSIQDLGSRFDCESVRTLSRQTVHTSELSVEPWDHPSSYNIFKQILNKVVAEGKKNLLGTTNTNPVVWRGEYLYPFGSSPELRNLPSCLVNGILSQYSIPQGDLAFRRGLALFTSGGKNGDSSALHLVLGPPLSNVSPPNLSKVVNGQRGRPNAVAITRKEKIPTFPPDSASRLDDVSIQHLPSFSMQLIMFKSLFHLPPFRLLQDGLKLSGVQQYISKIDSLRTRQENLPESLKKFCGRGLKSLFCILLDMYPEVMHSKFGLVYTINVHCRSCRRIQTTQKTVSYIDISQGPSDLSQADLSQAIKSSLIAGCNDLVCCVGNDSPVIGLSSVQVPSILAVFCRGVQCPNEQILSIDQLFGLPEAKHEYHLMSISSLKSSKQIWQAHIRQFQDGCIPAENAIWINFRAEQYGFKTSWSNTRMLFSDRSLQLFFVHTAALKNDAPLDTLQKEGLRVGSFVVAHFFSCTTYAARIIEQLDNDTFKISWDVDGTDEDTVKKRKDLRLLRAIEPKQSKYLIGARVSASRGDKSCYYNATIVCCFAQDRFLLEWDDGFEHYRVRFARDFEQPTVIQRSVRFQVHESEVQESEKMDSVHESMEPVKRKYSRREPPSEGKNTRQKVVKLSSEGTQDVSCISGKLFFSTNFFFMLFTHMFTSLADLEDDWFHTIFNVHPGIFTEERSSRFAAFISFDEHFEEYLENELKIKMQSLIDCHVRLSKTDFDKEGPLDSETEEMDLPGGIDRVVILPIIAQDWFQHWSGFEAKFVCVYKLSQPLHERRERFLVYFNDRVTFNDIQKAKRQSRNLKLNCIQAIGYIALSALTQFNEMPVNSARPIQQVQFHLLAKDHIARSSISDTVMEENIVLGMRRAAKTTSPRVDLVPKYKCIPKDTSL